MLLALIFAGVLGLQVPDYICRPADRAIRELGNRFGENWEVAADVGRNAVVVCPGDDDAGEVRAGLAEVLNAEWLEFDDRWVLRRSDDQRSELEDQERRIWVKAILKDQEEWKKSAQVRGSDPEPWLRKAENLLVQARRGDSAALQAFGDGATWNEMIAGLGDEVLASVSAEDLAKTNWDETVTFSTSPNGRQKQLNQNWVERFNRYQLRYAEALSKSYERVPHQEHDFREGLKTGLGTADKVLVNSVMSTMGTLGVRAYFVNQDGIVISEYSRHVVMKNLNWNIEFLKGVSIELPEKVKQAREALRKSEPAPSGRQLHPMLDVLNNDPQDWFAGSILNAIASKKEESLYANVSDYFRFGLINSELLGSQNLDAELVVPYLFGYQPVDAREENGTIFIEPIEPLKSEELTLDRGAFADFIDEARSDRFLRPFTVGRYAVQQDSLMALDSWDRWFVRVGFAVNGDQVSRLYRPGYLVLGTVGPRVGDHRTGQFAIIGSTAQDSIWRRLRRELTMDNLFDIAAYEWGGESEDHISRKVISETFPNEIPKDIVFWANVRIEDCLYLSGSYEGAPFEISLTDRSLDEWDYDNPAYKFAVGMGEFLQFGTGLSRKRINEVLFSHPVDANQYGSAKDLPEKWQEFMKDSLARSEERRRKEEQIKPPPP